MLVSGGLRTAAIAREVFEHTGAAAVLLARGSLGNPWLFEQVLGLRDEDPTREEFLAEVDWVLERAVEHMGPGRAARYLRKFYPWYVERLGEGKALQDALQRSESIERPGPPSASPRSPPRPERGSERVLRPRGRAGLHAHRVCE